jgi:hypothetical protein
MDLVQLILLDLTGDLVVIVELLRLFGGLTDNIIALVLINTVGHQVRRIPVKYVRIVLAQLIQVHLRNDRFVFLFTLGRAYRLHLRADIYRFGQTLR